MDQPENANIQMANPLALIFSNTRGQVIFSDLNYLRITGESAARIVIGEPLQEVLRIDPRSADQLLNMIGHGKPSHHLSIPVRAASGGEWHSDTTAIAVHDEKGNFIGIDLALVKSSIPDPAAVADLQFHNHGDVLKAYVETVFNEGNLLKSRTFMQSYLVAQLDVIQILLARIGGPAIRLAFEQVIVGTAKSNALPILMRNGHVEFNQREISLLGYRAVLSSAIAYAVDILGRHIVRREMLAVDRFLGPGTLELISQLDLKGIFPD